MKNSSRGRSKETLERLVATIKSPQPQRVREKNLAFQIFLRVMNQTQETAKEIDIRFDVGTRYLNRILDTCFGQGREDFRC